MSLWKLLPYAIALILTLGCVPRAQTATPHTLEQQEAIEAVTIERIQQPGLPNPTVEKITVIGDYGLASWLMGEAGGLVALIYQGNTWEAIALPGGLPGATDLGEFSGIPLDIAQQLLDGHFGEND